MLQINGGYELANHAGIATLPMQLATKFKIPLVFWGEHGWTDLGACIPCMILWNTQLI